MTRPEFIADRIGAIVARAQSEARVPGVVASVMAGGDVLHTASAGTGLDAMTQSRIGSVTKTFTATLVLRLRDAGELSLQAPLRTFLPSAPLGEVTIRQVLSHSSGLRREPGGPWWERAAGVDIPSLLADLTGDALLGRPSRRHHYSNLGYGLLGAVVSKITGDTWWEALRAQVIAPLGMARTSYRPQAPFATGYVVHPHDGRLRAEPRHDAGAMAPAGQLWSTVGDLARWGGFIANPDPAVLAPDTMDEMCAPVSMHDAAWSGAHGLGFEMWRSGDRIYTGHTGSMPGYLAALMVHRRSGLGVAAFVNAYTMRRGSISGLAQTVLNEVLGDWDPSPPAWVRPASPPEPVRELLGTWWWMGRAYDATWDGELVLSYRAGGAEPWRFAEISPDRWRCHGGMNDGETMMVRRDAAGGAELLDIATYVMSRDPWPPM